LLEPGGFLPFVVFFEFGFFFVKQLFDLRALRRIGRDREHCPVVLDVLPNDKTLQDKPPRVAPSLTLLTQINAPVVKFQSLISNGIVFKVVLATNRHGSS
jgi:hypothetical protein